MAVFQPSEKQVLACGLYIQGLSVKAVSDKIGISERTVYRWLEDPDFRIYLRQETERVYDRVLSQAVGLLSDGVTALRDIIKNSESDKDKLTAIKIAFDNGYRFKSNQLENRIEALEKELGVET